MAIIRATHVAIFLPEHLTNDINGDLWVLWKNDSGDPAEKAVLPPDAALGCLIGSEDTDPYDLTTWAISKIGAVHLGHRQEARIKTGWFSRTVIPFHYVFPDPR